MVITVGRSLAHGTPAAQPTPSQGSPLDEGLHRLATPTNPALLYVPRLCPFRPAPLLVALHGAGAPPRTTLTLFEKAADDHGTLLLAPSSNDTTWDAVGQGVSGDDAAGLQYAMGTVFSHFHVDADRIAVAGFSDGASYALGLGLANGDLFTRVMAYSPGFIPPVRRAGRPTIFLSHGRNDTVLPITRTSRRIVAALENDGYHVDYMEHSRGHEVPGYVVAASTELLG